MITICTREFKTGLLQYLIVGIRRIGIRLKYNNINRIMDWKKKID